ncbi:MAG: hypothetical protein ACFB15_25920 [Cyclobacteriaceae bacterium]
MGSGRVISAEPKSLKRICFLNKETDNFLRKLNPPKEETENFLSDFRSLSPDLKQFFSKIRPLSSESEIDVIFAGIHSLATNSDGEENIKTMIEEYISSQKATYKDELQIAEEIKFRLTKCLLNQEANLLQKVVDENNRSYQISGNDPMLSSIGFKDNEGFDIAHIDGILLDDETGQLQYFVAKSNVVKNFKKIEEGSKVHFICRYKGVCEIILHKREEHTNIIGDLHVDVDNIPSTVMRFVEVDKVLEAVEETPLPRYKVATIEEKAAAPEEAVAS